MPGLIRLRITLEPAQLAGKASPAMHIAWTTVSTREQAESLSSDIITQNLAACVQIDGPVTSLYRWDGRVEKATEFRLCIKCIEAQVPALEAFVGRHHPYEIPEWIVVRAEHVSEKYLSWAVAVSTSSTL